mmetsp:Transcript_54421/g.128508  ORF Transcript_54421/g.128508 Transcript_54421/m.128508 type:complete len:240 (+) Transcript_54421:120-839(+)
MRAKLECRSGCCCRQGRGIEQRHNRGVCLPQTWHGRSPRRVVQVVKVSNTPAHAVGGHTGRAILSSRFSRSAPLSTRRCCGGRGHTCCSILKWVFSRSAPLSTRRWCRRRRVHWAQCLKGQCRLLHYSQHASASLGERTRRVKCTHTFPRGTLDASSSFGVADNACQLESIRVNQIESLWVFQIYLLLKVRLGKPHDTGDVHPLSILASFHGTVCARAEHARRSGLFGSAWITEPAPFR